jgi:hypothetical protein
MGRVIPYDSYGMTHTQEIVCPQSDPALFFLHARTSRLSSPGGKIDNEQKISLWKILILTARWPNLIFKPYFRSSASNIREAVRHYFHSHLNQSEFSFHNIIFKN